MPLRTISDTKGDFKWTDGSDNVRYEDLRWLQERGIVRVAGTPNVSATLPTTSSGAGAGNVAISEEGRAFYDLTNHRLMVAIDNNPTYAYVVMSKKLQAVDIDSATTELRNTGSSLGTGLTITTNLASATAFKARTLYANNVPTGTGRLVFLGADPDDEKEALVLECDYDSGDASLDVGGDLSIAVGGSMGLPDSVVWAGDSTILNSWSKRSANRPNAGAVPAGTVWIPT